MAWERERETIKRETKTQRDSHASWDTDVIVPFGQSVLIASGSAIGGLVLVTALAIWQSWRFWIPLAAGGATGGIAFAISSILLTLDHRRLLWAAERALHVDLDQDGDVGEPETPREALQVELLENHGHRQRLSFIDLPGSDRQLISLAQGILNGKGTGEASWTGAQGPFSRSEFSALRDALIRRGLATWLNPNAHAQGWELTAAGRAVMRKIAQLEPTPLPRRGNSYTRGGRSVRVRA